MRQCSNDKENSAFKSQFTQQGNTVLYRLAAFAEVCINRAQYLFCFHLIKKPCCAYIESVILKLRALPLAYVASPL